ncbi:MAG: iron-sulfur cluster assembly scaffold protein [Steroidobacteraceae bacterium]|jgi:NifU-like protein involved in Fe-S cluster formation
MIYSELTRRYFEHAACAGAATGADWFRGEAGSRERGTWVQFDLQVPSAEHGGAVRSVRFLAFACPHVIAVCQWVAEQASGLALEARLPQNVQALRARFEVPVEKLGRLLVVEDAWGAAAGAAILRRNA